MTVQISEQSSEAGEASENEVPKRVVYLLGAGATHASVQYQGSARKLVMPAFVDELNKQMHQLYVAEFGANEGVRRLVNDMIDKNVDFEHLITFLEDTPSGTYKDFADGLKAIFSTVLRTALDEVRAELEPNYSELYAVLLDMHAVQDSNEDLVGFLTLNYDAFLEHAIEDRVGRAVSYGVDVRGMTGQSTHDPITVLKLHGSFGWKNAWPIELAPQNDPGLWIPPGIRKEKRDYPFNAIWGAAREMLDCDVLRIVGCNLGPNDWDLVSLLFTTRYGRASAIPYDVEVIAFPNDAKRIASELPYLNAKSLLEIPDVGPQLIAEVLGTDQIEFEDMDDKSRKRAIANSSTKISNPLEHWLRLKGEAMLQDLDIRTADGFFADFVESGA